MMQELPVGGGPVLQVETAAWRKLKETVDGDEVVRRSRLMMMRMMSAAKMWIERVMLSVRKLRMCCVRTRRSMLRWRCATGVGRAHLPSVRA